MVTDRQETSAEFTEWYSRIAEPLSRTLVGLTGERELARELAAEALARAWQRWPRLTADGRSPDAWTYRVAINLVKRHRRRTALQPEPHWQPATTTNPEPAYELWAHVARLPARQRQVVVLRYLADLPERQIADVLGNSEGAVSASLATARKALRKALEQTNG